MALTPGQIMLGDIFLSRLITITSIMKRIPSMTQEEVDVTTEQNEELLKREMAIMDSR